MSVQQSVRSYLGIAKEVTKGTIVRTNRFYPSCKRQFKPVDIIDPLYDTGLTRFKCCQLQLHSRPHTLNS
jgi:hypothetical protein